MGDAPLRVLAILLLSGALVAVPTRGARPSGPASEWPESLDEITEGMTWWLEHQRNPDCSHATMERFRGSCAAWTAWPTEADLRNYWSRVD